MAIDHKNLAGLLQATNRLAEAEPLMRRALAGGDFTKAELDDISSDHPILIWYINLHDACVNSEAFKIAGIGEDVGELPGGGHFGRGPDGKLNGMVYEESTVLKFAVHFLTKITPEVAAKAIGSYSHYVASVGNTMLHEPGTIRSDWIEPFAKLSNNLACRTSASVMFDDMKGLQPYLSLGLGPKGATVANSLFSLYGVKIVGDGSNQTETGAQTKPYLNSMLQGLAQFRRRFSRSWFHQAATPAAIAATRTPTSACSRRLRRRAALRLWTMNARSASEMSFERLSSQVCACVSAKPMSSASSLSRSGVFSQPRRAASRPLRQARNSRSAAIHSLSLSQRRKIASCATSA